MGAEDGDLLGLWLVGLALGLLDGFWDVGANEGDLDGLLLGLWEVGLALGEREGL